jgi:hypothetical protein
MFELPRLTQHLQFLSASQTDAMADRKPDITLYTDQTPNGIKISIALEELGIVSCLDAYSSDLSLIPSLSRIRWKRSTWGR